MLDKAWSKQDFTKIQVHWSEIRQYAFGSLSIILKLIV